MTDLKHPFHLAGKTVIVTGASSGIGRETAILCSQLGAIVVLTARDRDRLNETFREMVYSGHHQMVLLDLNDGDGVKNLVECLARQEIKVDGMVHAAGSSLTLPFKMSTPEKMEEQLRINSVSGFNLARELVRQRVNEPTGMSLVFLSSVMGMAGAVGRTAYSMSKGALIAGVRSMALELAPKKIRVNSVSPGVVDSPMSGASPYSQDPASLEKIRAQHPLGTGTTGDVAAACAYLMTDAARWVTGTNMVVDGGYSAGKL